jgi:hypothetical protein
MDAGLLSSPRRSLTYFYFDLVSPLSPPITLVPRLLCIACCQSCLSEKRVRACVCYVKVRSTLRSRPMHPDSAICVSATTQDIVSNLHTDCLITTLLVNTVTTVSPVRPSTHRERGIKTMLQDVHHLLQKQQQLLLSPSLLSSTHANAHPALKIYKRSPKPLRNAILRQQKTPTRRMGVLQSLRVLGRPFLLYVEVPPMQRAFERPNHDALFKMWTREIESG